jgi:DNA (cytosine-5)-methyltransferase 1
MNIFELLHEPLKLTQPIRMFEAFSGIGTQAMALKRLGVDYELVGFSEIDKYAIQSYHAIHGDVKNYGDITKMFDIPSCDIFTWSFPCTDLSKAGKRQGMTNDTRSGLVYEVLRLVRDTKDKPKVLIMENVPDLIQATFVRQFGEIQAELESYGYINYVETLNAKDYGIAQNRNRVFMVSILGDLYYEFPKPIPLTTRLKDYLEHDVDEKYYLDTQTIERISKWNAQQDPLERARTHDEISHTITTRVAESDAGGMSASVLLIKEPKISYALGSREHEARGWLDLAPTLCARDYKDPKVVFNDLRIRKLTPRECWRLMGCSDEDFNKAQTVCSNSQLYKQAGNAIVVDTFQAILKNMI